MGSPNFQYLVSEILRYNLSGITHVGQQLGKPIITGNLELTSRHDVLADNYFSFHGLSSRGMGIPTNASNSC